MKKSKVLEKLRKGKPVLCAKTNFNEPAIIEQIGLIGFDCVWLCREHLWANDETLANIIRAARSTDMDAMVRIGKESYISAIRPMEMGAKGIMVPHILSVEEAKSWIRATRFYPEGRRGIDGVNADADWGLSNFKDYLKFSNQETFLVFQIEDPEILPKIEEIAQLPNFEILFVGIGDLSHSLGFPGEIERKEIWEVLEKVGKICQKYGKFAGAPGVSPSYTKKLLDLGYLFVSNGADILFLRDGFLKLKENYEKIGFSF